MSEKNPSEKLTGQVHRITFCNAQTGYCVIKVKPTDSDQAQLFDVPRDPDQKITVTGSLQMIKEGDEVEFSGDWKSHAKYGTYLDVKNFSVKTPSTTEGLKRFVSNSWFKGIGEKTAAAMIDKFGEKLPEIIEKSPEKLTQIKGITKEKAANIKKVWQDVANLREQMIFLQGLGLTPNMSQRIIDRYHQQAFAKIRENPYQLAEDMWGVGFQKADAIAKSMGFGNDDPHRIWAGIGYTLLQAVDNGHMFLPMEALVPEAQKILGVNTDIVTGQIEKMINSEELMVEYLTDTNSDRVTNAVYLKTYYNLESNLAKQLKKLAGKEALSKVPPGLKKLATLNFMLEFEKIEQSGGLKLALEQKKAVQTSLISPITILTGGPGTGKSTAINTLIKLMEEHGMSEKDYVLVAPTGRAAKRMSEITSRRAQTIHRLLKLMPGTEPEFNHLNPLPYQMIIVDEVSMLDAFLASFLFRAIKPGTHVLLVGDADQLPSVQAGNILADMIKSDEFPVIELTQIFRQAKNSAIITNAHRIRQGIFPEFPEHPTDFYLSTRDNLEAAREEIVELVTERIPKNFRFDPMQDVQVLAPLYKTAAGVSELNSSLQRVLNPKRPSSKEFQFGFQLFREGDRVMQLKNNYDKDVFNGEMGRIATITKDKSSVKVTVNFGQNSDRHLVEYTPDDLYQITLAYAVSVHKSQGSEYPVVVMPVLTSHFIMLQRNLLYTAITRAKELVILVGSKKAIFIALKNDKPQLRYSGLCERLRTTSTRRV